jgi:hypothetical protein
MGRNDDAIRLWSAAMLTFDESWVRLNGPALVLIGDQVPIARPRVIQVMNLTSITLSQSTWRERNSLSAQKKQLTRCCKMRWESEGDFSWKSEVKQGRKVWGL